jgi:hypothetical protein
LDRPARDLGRRHGALLVAPGDEVVEEQRGDPELEKL